MGQPNFWSLLFQHGIEMFLVKLPVMSNSKASSWLISLPDYLAAWCRKLYLILYLKINIISPRKEQQWTPAALAQGQRRQMLNVVNTCLSNLPLLKCCRLKFVSEKEYQYILLAKMFPEQVQKCLLKNLTSFVLFTVLGHSHYNCNTKTFSSQQICMI